VTRALLLLTTVLLVAAGCGSGGSKSAATTTQTVTTNGRFRYPANVRENYMRSCMKNNVTQKYCACTLDKLSATVSTGDFARIGLSGGKIPARIRNDILQAAAACKDKL
jgi:hypothetical protein